MTAQVIDPTAHWDQRYVLQLLANGVLGRRAPVAAAGTAMRVYRAFRVAWLRRRR